MKQQKLYSVGYDRARGKDAAEVLPVNALVDRQVADEFAGLTVHGKGVFISVPCSIEKPYGVEGIVLFSA